ncbi:Fic/DOC family protein [Paenibacillus algorifonticola]|uniref:Fic/DOC family protein n=1 Tax=Paenibacillus algorifonticola TaxID=684063 RepID=A0A1I1Y3D2_9BACL|nr:Fic family protein [Paenibacillus algorifonticola]SFE12583.1 Fic/DOC family protein [Paenibacillus algorifonticola]
MDFQRINELKQELDSLMPLPSAAVRNLEEVYRVEWTYNSNAIEGNTLTLLETKLVLEEGLTIGGKKLREHFEVINHSEAISYVQDIVHRNMAVTESVIKSIHHLVLKNIDDENAGRYRSINVRISGSQHTPPTYVFVPEKMESLLHWYHEQHNSLHPVELAARLHFQFVFIHPFADGNGRTARLLMNLVLMQHGFPPAIVKAAADARLKYYETLEDASSNDQLEPFIALIADCVEDSLLTYISSVK